MTRLICDEDLYELRREMEADAAEEEIFEEAEALGWHDCEHCEFRVDCEAVGCEEEDACEAWELSDEAREAIAEDLEYDRSLEATYDSMRGRDV